MVGTTGTISIVIVGVALLIIAACIYCFKKKKCVCCQKKVEDGT